jgi:putative NADH-flavin reductase
MKLLIIGATGATGRELVNQALAQGHEVTALVRNAARAAFDPSVKIAVGDVLDAASLKAALIGQETVISSLGSAASGPFKEVTMLSEGTRNLIAAMKATGVDRLICITGFGAGESKRHLPWVAKWLIQPLALRGVYRDKTRQENLVRASGLDWTLVRPNILANGAAKGIQHVRAFAALTGTHVGMATIRRADVAAFCLRELTDRRFRHMAPVITN